MLEIDLRTRLKALVDTRLKALVGTWRGQVTKSDRAFGYRLLAAASIKECADQLAALLAESEPEPCSQWRHGEHDGEDGHVFCDVLCADCGMRRDVHPDCEAKAKLPLGHEFVPHKRQARADRCGVVVQMCGTDQPMFRVVCGQPRSAHEAREAD